MENLTRPSKIAIGIAGLLALLCMMAIAIAFAQGTSSLTVTEHDKPAANMPISDNMLPPYRPYAVSASSIAFEKSIDTSRIRTATISNYPRLGPNPFRYTQDRAIIEKATLCLEGARFTRWDGYDAFMESRKHLAGGYASSLALEDASGNTAASIYFNPGVSRASRHAEDDQDKSSGDTGIYMLENNACYVMEGDQSLLIALLEELVEEAREETGVSKEDPQKTPVDERVWLYENELEEAAQEPSASRYAS